MELLGLVIVVALAYVAYINRDKLKALFDRVANKDDGLDAEPSVSTRPYVPNSGTVVPNSGTANVADEAMSVAPTATHVTNQDEHTAWRNSLAPSTRAFVSETWTPPPDVIYSAQDDAAQPVINGMGPVLNRGERVKMNGLLMQVISFPISAGATRVTIAETSETGDHVQYNLWISETPQGPAVAGIPEHSFQYNAATVIFSPSEGALYANVRALVEGGRPFYIQAN